MDSNQVPTIAAARVRACQQDVATAQEARQLAREEAREAALAYHCASTPQDLVDGSARWDRAAQDYDIARIRHEHALQSLVEAERQLFAATRS